MNSLRRLGASVPGAFGFPLGAALAVLVTIALAVDHGTAHPAWAMIASAATVVVLSVLTTPVAVLGTAVLSWFLLEGFVVGREGQVAPNLGSLRAAGVLVLTALACVALTTTVRTLTNLVPAPVRRPATESVPANG
ncbi:MAG TPA: hypothetical protein VGG05_20680 [Pseudonocardiaceae bacterium]